MVKMTYTGPGTKPDDIEVEEFEAVELEKSGLWQRAGKKKEDVKSSDSGKADK
jgi:hypothetical protein